jgi:hypothetical protein
MKFGSLNEFLEFKLDNQIQKLEKGYTVPGRHFGPGFRPAGSAQKPNGQDGLGAHTLGAARRGHRGRHNHSVRRATARWWLDKRLLFT